VSISRPRRPTLRAAGVLSLGFGDVASSSARGHPRMTSRLFDALGTEPPHFAVSHFAFPSQCCSSHCVRGCISIAVLQVSLRAREGTMAGRKAYLVHYGRQRCQRGHTVLSPSHDALLSQSVLTRRDPGVRVFHFTAFEFDRTEKRREILNKRSEALGFTTPTPKRTTNDRIRRQRGLPDRTAHLARAKRPTPCA